MDPVRKEEECRKKKGRTLRSTEDRGSCGEAKATAVSGCAASSPTVVTAKGAVFGTGEYPLLPSRMRPVWPAAAQGYCAGSLATGEMNRHAGTAPSDGGPTAESPEE